MLDDVALDDAVLHENVARILVVEEEAVVTPQLLEAIRQRAAMGPTQFRVVVPNPAAAEIHLLHPERHEKAAEAEVRLRSAMPQLEEAAGGIVIGTVSVRHDPMDAIEDVLFNEPIDEIILSVTTHTIARWLHQDLQARLRHYGLPVTTLDPH
ncbi:MAG: hypothetical protein ACJ72E_16530 [Marmoricola sp.]